MFGFIPKSNIERLKTSLEPIPSTLVVFGEKDTLAAVGLFGLMRDTDILRRAARSAYLNPITVPSDYRGTPREILTSLHFSIERATKRIVTYQEEVHVLQETRIRRMRHLQWRLRVSLHLTRIISGFRKMGVNKAAPCHCAGDKAIDLFKREYGNDFVDFRAGSVVTL